MRTIICLLVTTFALKILAIDWPQWRGPNRDGVNTENDLLDQWPEGGPKLAWKSEGVGGGYSSVVTSKGVIYTLGDLEDACYLIALDTNGKHLWKAKVGEPGGHRGYPGPRSTPTVDNGNVYVLGQQGDLVCFDIATKKETWRRNLARDFGGRMMSGWRWSESPLVDGKQIVVTPGGDDGAVIALNKENGTQVWRTKDFTDRAGYSSIIIREIGKKRQYLQLTGNSVVGIDTTDGSLLWKAPRAGRTAVVTTPIFHEDTLFVTSSYGVGCNGFRVTAAGEKFEAKQLYAHKTISNHHGGCIRVGSYVYGSSGNTLACIDLKTGKTQWSERSAGKGAILVADGKIILRTERGPVSLVKLNPDEYEEISRFNQPDRTRRRAWSHPVVSNGILYLKDQDTLFAYDIKED